LAQVQSSSIRFLRALSHWNVQDMVSMSLFGSSSPSAHASACSPVVRMAYLFALSVTAASASQMEISGAGQIVSAHASSNLLGGKANAIIRRHLSAQQLHNSTQPAAQQQQQPAAAQTLERMPIQILFGISFVGTFFIGMFFICIIVNMRPSKPAHEPDLGGDDHTFGYGEGKGSDKGEGKGEDMGLDKGKGKGGDKGFKGKPGEKGKPAGDPGKGKGAPQGVDAAAPAGAAVAATAAATAAAAPAAAPAAAAPKAAAVPKQAGPSHPVEGQRMHMMFEIKNGTDMPSVNTFGGCDPFVEVRVVKGDPTARNGGIEDAVEETCKKKTKSIDGELNPTWNETLTLQGVYGADQFVQFILWDSNVAKNTPIGFHVVNTQEFVKGQDKTNYKIKNLVSLLKDKSMKLSTVINLDFSWSPIDK